MPRPLAAPPGAGQPVLSGNLSPPSARQQRYAPRIDDLARDAQVAICLGDDLGEPADTAPFVYARLQNARTDEPAGYPQAELDAWATRVKDWAAGPQPRPVFLFFIDGAKERAPAAARALLDRMEAPQR